MRWVYNRTYGKNSEIIETVEYAEGQGAMRYVHEREKQGRFRRKKREKKPSSGSDNASVTDHRNGWHFTICLLEIWMESISVNGGYGIQTRKRE